MLFLNRYKKRKRAASPSVLLNAVTGTQTPVLGVAPAGQSDWISSRKACCAAEGEREKIASVNNGSGLLGQSHRHPNDMPATLQWPCSCLLCTKHHTQNPCRSHGLQEEFGILDEALICIGVESWRSGVWEQTLVLLLFVVTVPRAPFYC